MEKDANKRILKMKIAQAKNKIESAKESLKDNEHFIKFEKQVNDWLLQHPNIEILHRYVNNDWVSHTGVSGLGTITTAMITAIVEYKETKEKPTNYR